MEKERAAHHSALAALYKQLTGEDCDGLKLWRKLARIEREAHAGATAYCNGEKFGTFDFCRDENAWENFTQFLTSKVRAVFGGKLPPGFFVSGDARGYALKLAPGSVTIPGFHQDWGINLILAPLIG